MTNEKKIKQEPWFSENLPDKEYYTVDDLASYYCVSSDYIRELVKYGRIKTVNVGNQYMLVPRESTEKGELDYYLGQFRINAIRATEARKITLADKIRQGLIFLSVVIFVPLITLVAFTEVVGVDYAFSEDGQLIGIGLIIVSSLVAYIAYKVLFSKYSDDLPETFF